MALNSLRRSRILGNKFPLLTFPPRKCNSQEFLGNSQEWNPDSQTGFFLMHYAHQFHAYIIKVWPIVTNFQIHLVTVNWWPRACDLKERDKTIDSEVGENGDNNEMDSNVTSCCYHPQGAATLTMSLTISPIVEPEANQWCSGMKKAKSLACRELYAIKVITFQRKWNGRNPPPPLDYCGSRRQGRRLNCKRAWQYRKRWPR